MDNSLYGDLLIFIDRASPFTLISIVISFLAVFVGRIIVFRAEGNPREKEKGVYIALYGSLVFPITAFIFELIPMAYTIILSHL